MIDRRWAPFAGVRGARWCGVLGLAWLLLGASGDLRAQPSTSIDCSASRVQLRHLPADRAEAIYRRVVSPNAVIVAYPASDTLWVEDSSENLCRFRQILRFLDTPGGRERRI